MTKKVVLKLQIHDNKQKRKAMRAVSGFLGIDSLAVDLKEKKLTVVGDVDPVLVVCKLRKFWDTEILSVGPAKEPDNKKEDDKKDGKKKEDDKKKESEQLAELLKLYKNFNPCYPQYYHVYDVKENPNSCVIC